MADAKRLVLREFRFLEKEFDFKVVEVTEVPYVSVTYQNPTTALEAGYEPRDRGVFVLLMRLVEGRIPPYPVTIRPADTLHVFYLDDLVEVRRQGVSDDKQPTDFARAASDVRTYAADVLSGDFEVFLDLEKIVKSR